MFAPVVHLSIVLAALASPHCPIDVLPPGALQRLGNPRFHHGIQVVNSTLSPDGKLLATAGPRSVAVWDVATGKRLHTVFRAAPDSWPFQMIHLQFSASSKLLAVGSDLWNLQTGKKAWQYDRKIGYPRWAAFGKTDDILYIASAVIVKGNEYEERLQTWCISKNELLSSRPCDQNVRNHYSEYSKYVIHSTHNNSRVSIEEIGSWTRSIPVERPDNWQFLNCSPNGARITGVSFKSQFGVFDSATGKIIWINPLPPPLFRRNEKNELVFGTAFPQYSEDGNEIWLETKEETDSTLFRFTASTGRSLPPLIGHSSGVLAAHYPPDGKSIVTVGCDGSIARWDRATGKIMGEPPTSTGFPAFSADGKQFGVARKNIIALYDTARGTVRKLPSLQPDSKALALNRDGSRAATRSMNCTVHVVDVRTGKTERILTSPKLRISIGWVEFSPDGSEVADVSPWETRTWDLKSGRFHSFQGIGFTTHIGASRQMLVYRPRNYEVYNSLIEAPFRQLPIHPVNPRSPRDPVSTSLLKASPDGRWLAAAYENGGLIVQDLLNGKLIKRLDLCRHGYFIHSPFTVAALTFSADGKWLAVGTATHAVEVWEVASGTRMLRYEGHDAPVCVVQFAADGRSLWSASGDGLAYRWELWPRSPRRQEWSEVWNALSHGSSEAAFAIRRILDDPAAAVSFLRTMYAPLSDEERKQIERNIADLANEDYAVRENAEQKLFGLGIKGVALLEAACRDANAERSARAERLLRRLAPLLQSAVRRAERITAALELAGTPETRGLLEEWVRNPPDAALAAEAKAALRRHPRE